MHRKGSVGDKRVYALCRRNAKKRIRTVTAQDNAGNPSLATTTVIVPHDQGR